VSILLIFKNTATTDLFTLSLHDALPICTRFGVKAVQLINEGHFGSMVSYQNYQVRHVPIADAVNRLRLVPPNGEMVQTARDVERSEEHTSELQSQSNLVCRLLLEKKKKT